MPQTINTNLASLNAQRNLNASQTSLATSIQRLSSGLRVNSAKDDAAGLAIAERFSTQIRGSTVAIRNANDGISLAQTAEGGLSKASDALQRLRELAVQARNATNTTSDLDSIGQEYGQLTAEITRVLGGTTFNGKAILGPDAGTNIFQVGPNTTANDEVAITTNDLTVDPTIAAVTSLTISNVDTPATIKVAIDSIDSAITTISGQRAVLGAAQNRFEAVISNLQTAVENQSASRSRILDADFAVETSNLSRAQILQQAGNAMVAQANQLPQQVLALLKG
jgi:flagellin